MDIGYLIVGMMFAIYGVSTLITSHAKIGRSPIFVINIDGIVAKILGITLIIGGFLFGLPTIIYIFDNDAPSVIYWLSFFGIGLINIGMFFSIIMQTAISFGDYLHRRREKSK